jgi:hypothetical protein
MNAEMPLHAGERIESCRGIANIAARFPHWTRQRMDIAHQTSAGVEGNLLRGMSPG